MYINRYQVDEFCRGKHCCVPKPFNKLGKSELAKVISQVEQMLKKA